MLTFPVMLDLSGRLVVVVGGGPVGLRRVRALRGTGAEVRVVCRDRPRRLPPGVVLVPEAYRAQHLTGAALVLACTADPALNQTIAADARRAGALANVADQPEDCDFHLPAVARDGSVVLAVGTGGAAPALAGAIARRLRRAMPRRVGAFAALLGRVRRELKRQVHDPARRAALLKELAGERMHKTYLAGGARAVRAALRRRMGG